MTRKQFLQFLLVGLTAGAAGSLLAACSKKEETAQTRPAGGGPQKTPETAPGADPCSDVSGLTEADLKMRRETLQYVAVTPDPAKRCDNCKFWTPGADAQACGTCTLIKGPIHPGGYCVSWFTREA